MFGRLVKLLVVALGFVAVQATADIFEPTVVLTSKTSGVLEDALQEVDVDFFRETRDGIDYVNVFVSEHEYPQIQSLPGSFSILQKSQPFSQKNSSPPDCYLDFEGMVAAFEDVANRFPNLAQMQDSRDWAPGVTYEGRMMPIIKISDNVSVDEDEQNILIVAAHHAREIVTPQIVLDLARRLTANYETDPRIRNIVDNNEIWLSPVWNPDGYSYVFSTNDLWRKNRKPFNSTSFGVDQNRNYNLNWGGYPSNCAGSSDPNSNTYRGVAPESEEETQTVVALSRDRNIAKMLTLHSSGREVLLGIQCEPRSDMMEEFNDFEGRRLAPFADYRVRKPGNDGEHEQWTMKDVTTYAFLVETATTFQPPFSAALEEIERLWPLLREVLEVPISLRGHVRDPDGRPLAADISIPGIYGIPTGYTRRSDGRFGVYHLWLSDGTYEVTFAAAGFIPSTEVVTIRFGQSVNLDVVLQIDD